MSFPGESQLKALEKIINQALKLDPLALQKVESKKYLVVVYRELKKDGFIITAFLTRRIKSLMKRKQIWPD